MKVTEQSFPVVLFITLYEFLTFESVHEILTYSFPVVRKEKIKSLC